MSETVLSWTQLPNLHPAVVHFPIALLPVAVLFDVAAAIARKHPWLDRAAAAVYTLAALGAVAAWLAGRQAVDSLGLLPPQVVSHVNTHADWGLYALWATVVVALARLGLTWWDRGLARPLLRAALLPLGAIAVFVVFRTADLGGGLVYAHGVAVHAEAMSREGEAREAEATRNEAASAAADPGARLSVQEDGALVWTPRAGDGAVLGTLLIPAGGSSLDAVRAVAPEEGAAGGLRLAVSGATLLVFAPELGSVQVEAELELLGFRGTIGLAHHVRSASEAGLFLVEAPSGAATLATRTTGGARLLDEKTAALPGGVLRLAVSAAGRHLRGLIDGEMVVHGHQPELPPGRVGLLLDGEGELVVRRFTASPVSP
ncbi:MAG TPA: DUF2231 domain-containing protein [Thermoanaerobaculia bacterium]|nr:DUF2231 domain-containing protein [Thermoanaerobaculia bacterium]